MRGQRVPFVVITQLILFVLAVVQQWNPLTILLSTFAESFLLMIFHHIYKLKSGGKETSRSIYIAILFLAVNIAAILLLAYNQFREYPVELLNLLTAFASFALILVIQVNISRTGHGGLLDGIGTRGMMIAVFLLSLYVFGGEAFFIGGTINYALLLFAFFFARVWTDYIIYNEDWNAALILWGIRQQSIKTVSKLSRQYCVTFACPNCRNNSFFLLPKSESYAIKCRMCKETYLNVKCAECTAYGFLGKGAGKDWKLGLAQSILFPKTAIIPGISQNLSVCPKYWDCGECGLRNLIDWDEIVETKARKQVGAYQGRIGMERVKQSNGIFFNGLFSQLFMVVFTPPLVWAALLVGGIAAITYWLVGWFNRNRSVDQLGRVGPYHARAGYFALLQEDLEEPALVPKRVGLGACGEIEFSGYYAGLAFSSNSYACNLRI